MSASSTGNADRAADLSQKQSVRNNRWIRCWHIRTQEEDRFTCAREGRWTRRGSQMAGFLDNFRWPEWEWIDLGERRNTVASIVAGVLVSGSKERENEWGWQQKYNKSYSLTVCVSVCMQRKHLTNYVYLYTNLGATEDLSFLTENSQTGVLGLDYRKS